MKCVGVSRTIRGVVFNDEGRNGEGETAISIPG
jgi:hypothetical protein